MGYLPYLSTFDIASVVMSHVELKDYSIGALESLVIDTRELLSLQCMVFSILSLALVQLVRQRLLLTVYITPFFYWDVR